VRRSSILTLALLLCVPLVAGIIPAGAAAGSAVTHLQPDHLPSCLVAGAWNGACAEFGAAVATDGEMVVVGAPAQPMTVGDTTFFSVGAAYVYTEGGAGWSREEIHASDADVWDRFGSSVAADAGRFVVGARSAGVSFEGQAYLYEPNQGGGWDEMMLDPDDAGNYSSLGRSAAIDGDRIVVSASGADVDDGVVYLFEDGAGGWARTQRLTSGETTDEGFGYSVDVDGGRIVVGAPYYGDYTPSDPDDLPENTGRVFVYTWNGATWNRETFSAPTEEEWQLYGFSVAVDGDTVFVGARNRSKVPGADDQGGAVFAYTWTGVRWVEETITPAVHPDGQGFGVSVSAAGGLLAVGAVGDNRESNAQGAAYLFHKPRKAWVGEQVPEPATAQGEGDKLGYAVAVGGDIVVAGAPETKFVGSIIELYGHGSAYLYRTCAGSVATIVGTIGNDILSGTLGNDVIAGLAGDDSIDASRGHDLVCAGPGRDRVKAGAGKDTLYGEADNDFLYGNAHDDWLYGGVGIDVLFGMAGGDLLDGGAGRDVASFPTAPGPVTASLATGAATGDGTDILTALEVLVGGVYGDDLSGDAGGNRLVGRDGDDTLAGGDGKDVLSGGRGDDTLDGEGGDDTLDGGPDTDTCTGEITINCE